MKRQHPYLERRHTGRRSVDVPVDALGRQRARAALTDVSVRMDDDDAGAEIGFRGHAAMFNSPTWIGGRQFGFMEQIAESAFTKTVDEADVRFLINHDPNLLLARNKAGNLRLENDEVGLAVDADMIPTSYARDLALLMAPTGDGERSTIDQMSFAFEIIQEEWRYVEPDDNDEFLEGRGYDLYTITEARLWDVSVVTYPAYDDTDAALRAAAFDDLTRELGVDDVRSLLRSVAQGDAMPHDLAGNLRAAAGTRSRENLEPPSGTRDEGRPPSGTDAPTEPTATDNNLARMRGQRMAQLETRLS